MKKVKAKELREGDVFIRGGRYYEVIDTRHVRTGGYGIAHPDYFIKAKCFMASSRVAIGRIIYVSMELEVWLCEL